MSPIKSNKNILIAIIKLNMPENLVFFVISSLLTASRDLQKNRSIRLIDRKRERLSQFLPRGKKSIQHSVMRSFLWWKKVGPLGISSWKTISDTYKYMAADLFGELSER